MPDLTPSAVATLCDALARYIDLEVCGGDVYVLDGGVTMRERVRDHYHDAPELLRMWAAHLRERRRLEVTS